MKSFISNAFNKDDVVRLCSELLKSNVSCLYDENCEFEYDATMMKITYTIDNDFDKQLFMLSYGSAFIFYGYLINYNILKKVRVVELLNDNTAIMFSYEKNSDLCPPIMMPTDSGLSDNEVIAYMRSIIKMYLDNIITVIKSNTVKMNDSQYLIKFITYLQKLSTVYGLPDTDRVNSVLSTVKQVCEFNVSKRMNDAFVTLSLA